MFRYHGLIMMPRRGDPAGPAIRRAHRDPADRTRSTARLDGAAQTARKLTRNSGQIGPRPRPHRGRASFANGQNFREVRLHQCPSERKGQGVPVRSLRVPSHVPSHSQTAAKVRGFSPIASGFTAETDWLLEEAGFELSVPPRESSDHLQMTCGRGRAAAWGTSVWSCGLACEQFVLLRPV